MARTRKKAKTLWWAVSRLFFILLLLSMLAAYISNQVTISSKQAELDALNEQIAQQQDLVRLLGVHACQQFFTIVGRPVQVGGDEQFHLVSPPGISLYFFTMAFISSKCSSISATSLNWVRQRTRLWVGYWVLK